MKRLGLNFQSGQSLIEVLTALAVVLLVIIALIRATTIAIKSSDFSKTQALATVYTQEAMEWIRAERDKGWDNISDQTPVNSLCLNELSWLGGSCDYILADRFKREVSLANVGGEGNKIEVKVVVSWQDAGGDHQSQLTTYLSNWR